MICRVSLCVGTGHPFSFVHYPAQQNEPRGVRRSVCDAVVIHEYFHDFKKLALLLHCR